MNDFTVRTLFENGCLAQERNDMPRSIARFREVLEMEPSHRDARYRLALLLFQSGHPDQSAKELGILVTGSPGNVEFRIRYGQVLSSLGRFEEAGEQLLEAIRLDPANIVLHLNHGMLCLEAGNRDLALSSFQRAKILAPLMGSYAKDARVPVPLRKSMEVALDRLNQIRHDFIESTLDSVVSEYPGADLSRLKPAIENIGRLNQGDAEKNQHPALFYMPGLPARGWYDRVMFPWIDAAEALYPAIQSELDALLRSDTAFSPYLPGDGARTWDESLATLRGSMEWNAFHLYRKGKRFPANCEQCPTTASLTEIVPFPHIRQNSPELFFSRLRPGTHIKPHFGILNVRLTVHMGLKIPRECGIRVGEETRCWEPGKVFAFDDSFNHEAWNRSGEERIVLIFEVWNPDLSDAERFGVEQFFERRRAWLDRFDDDPMLPPAGTQPRLEW